MIWTSGSATILGAYGSGMVTLNSLVSEGRLTKLSSGTLFLNYANTYAEGLMIGNGMLTVGNQNALSSGPVTLAGGTTLQQVNFEGFGSGGVLSNNSALNGGMVSSFVSFGITKDLWLGGLVFGPGGLRIYGAQRGLTLSSDNIFIGGVTVDGDPNGIQVNVTHVNGLGTGPLSLGSGAKAQFNYSGDRVVTALTLNGVVQPNGTYGSSASEATTVDDAHFTGTVTVGLHQQAKILSFVFEELPAAVLNEVNHTIQLTVPPDTDVTGLAPSYTLSLGATGTPASGATPDFSTPQNDTVTSEDGATIKIYAGSVTVAVTIQLVTISGISQPVAGPGVGEFTVALSGNSNCAGDVVI